MNGGVSMSEYRSVLGLCLAFSAAVPGVPDDN
jgi:hypothetical protein